MKLIAVLTMCVLFVLAGGSAASAQLSEGPIVYGHHHLLVTSVAEHRPFWVDTLGGTPTPLPDGREIFKFPNGLVFLRVSESKGGNEGTAVNHVGFGVPSVRAMLDKVRAAGYPIVTRAEVPHSLDVKDDMAYMPSQDTYVAFVMAPDNVKVEFVENRTQTLPITLHHIHFATEQVDEMRAWYVEMFNARPVMWGSSQAADLAGLKLIYSPSTEPVESTRGHALDHIGFEVENLETFCKELEAQGITLDFPYTVVPGPPDNIGIAESFFTDPFGTRIQLTEGLDKF